jgi:organic hydroperoxide reductase OsmC/OhrA
MEEILALAKQRGITLRSFELVQDNRYTMEGSAVRGTMTGSALPVDIDVRLETDADKDVINELVCAAIAASPASGLLREVLTSKFTVTSNGNRIAPGRVAVVSGETVDDPREVFDSASPESAADVVSDIITKVESAETLFGVEGGAGSSLAAEQKRELHVRAICGVREDGIKEIRTQLLKPIGSVFQFLSDDSPQFGGQGRAPSGLDYLVAGIAFCYMTQLGRYATIVKKPLDGYRIVQDTGFSLPGASGGTGQAATANPVDTHVFVESQEGDDYARQLVDMGEQTCFLHAACRAQVKSRIRLQ